MGEQLTKEDMNLVGEMPRISITHVKSKATTEIRPLTQAPQPEPQIGEAYYTEVQPHISDFKLFENSELVLDPLPEEPVASVAVPSPLPPEPVRNDMGAMLALLVAAVLWKLLTRKTRKDRPQFVPGLQQVPNPSRIDDLPVGSIDVMVVTNSGSTRHADAHTPHGALPAAAQSRRLQSAPAGYTARSAPGHEVKQRAPAHAGSCVDACGYQDRSPGSQGSPAQANVPVRRPSVADYLLQQREHNRSGV